MMLPLGRPSDEAESAENWFSILYVEPQDDKSGTLLEILQCFKDEKINLTRIRSQNRPGGQPHGFILEMEGNPEDLSVKNAIRCLDRQKVAMKLLGVFPATPGSTTPENFVISTGMTVPPTAP